MKVRELYAGEYQLYISSKEREAGTGRPECTAIEPVVLDLAGYRVWGAALTLEGGRVVHAILLRTRLDRGADEYVPAKSRLLARDAHAVYNMLGRQREGAYRVARLIPRLTATAPNEGM